jgi:DNA-binding NtrC family response regulator
MVSSNALIVSPHRGEQQSLAGLLEKCNLASILASTIREAESILKTSSVRVILSSDELPDGGFSDVLRLSKNHRHRIPVIVFSRLADWEGYLNYVRAGAFDYVLYPPVYGEIERAVGNALSYDSLERADCVASAA